MIDKNLQLFNGLSLSVIKPEKKKRARKITLPNLVENR